VEAYKHSTDRLAGIRTTRRVERTDREWKERKGKNREEGKDKEGRGQEWKDEPSNAKFCLL